MNISKFSNIKTARTCPIAAKQRAENFAILGCKKVLELCVGPSLKILEDCYREFGIEVVGNDIDLRWQLYYPSGRWVIGDACKIQKDDYDVVVVAPPLSRGCSGRRNDALSLQDVRPGYSEFLNLKSKYSCYVLPGKTLSIKEDRKQLHKFLSVLPNYEVIPLHNKVVKYVDVIVKNEYHS